jgi:CRISPR-associated exonuclease Cas4
MWWLIIAGLSVAIVGLLVWLWSVNEAKATGLPAHYRVIYADTGGWERVERSLHSEHYRLAGKPDYVLRTRFGPVPVEVKPTRQADQPYESDILQLAAYCLLLEEDWQQKPAYALLRYANQTFRIEWSTALKNELLATLEEMRELNQYPATLGCDLPEPQHDMTKRCQNCGFHYICYSE